MGTPSRSPTSGFRAANTAFWMRVGAGLAIVIVVAIGTFFASRLWGHEGRITTLEVHIPYIKDALQRIESKLDKGPRVP